MKIFYKILIIIFSLLVGLIVGYCYGFRGYNRRIKKWEFWLKQTNPIGKKVSMWLAR